MSKTLSTSQLNELVRLNRRFGVLVNGGASIPEALGAMQPEASPAFQRLIAHVIERVQSGGSLTEALNDFPEMSPAIYRDWVRMGEETGTVGDGALEIAELLEPLAVGGGEHQLGWERIESAVALIQFTRRCAELLDKGLEWWRVLYLLVHEAPPAFADYIGKMLPKRDDARGFLSLSQRMEEFPEIFSPFYRAMVRLGWEARAMDEVMRGLADLLFEDWTLSRSLRCYPERAAQIIDHGAAPAGSWDELTPAQATLVTVLFCRAASLLLSIGYEPAEVLQTCGLLLPARQQAQLAEVCEGGDLSIARALTAPGCFSPFVMTLLERGQARNRIEFAFTQAAKVLREEMMKGRC